MNPLQEFFSHRSDASPLECSQQEALENQFGEWWNSRIELQNAKECDATEAPSSEEPLAPPHSEVLGQLPTENVEALAEDLLVKHSLESHPGLTEEQIRELITKAGRNTPAIKAMVEMYQMGAKGNNVAPLRENDVERLRKVLVEKRDRCEVTHKQATDPELKLMLSSEMVALDEVVTLIDAMVQESPSNVASPDEYK